MLITSPNNPQVKQIRALRQRKEREQRGCYFVEGIRIVAEAVELAAAIELLIVAPDLLTSAFAGALVETGRAQGVDVLDVSAEVFRSLSTKDGPQGLGAVLRQRWERIEEVTLPPLNGTSSPSTPALQPGGLWVALDEIADPGNLGAILRTCDATGAAGVLLLGNTTDPYDPAALRASMGAIIAQRLVRASFAEFSDWKRRQGIAVVGTSGGAPLDYQAYTYPMPAVLLMGSERQGLDAAQRAVCDAVVGIPMAGRSDSLNLAVATAVVLYEIFNQRRRQEIGDRG